MQTTIDFYDNWENTCTPCGNTKRFAFGPDPNLVFEGSTQVNVLCLMCGYCFAIPSEYNKETDD